MRQTSLEEQHWRLAYGRVADLKFRHPERKFRIRQHYVDTTAQNAYDEMETVYVGTYIQVGVPYKCFFGRIKLGFVDLERIAT